MVVFSGDMVELEKVFFFFIWVSFCWYLYFYFFFKDRNVLGSKIWFLFLKKVGFFSLDILKFYFFL